jgi:uncharacterized protein (DUF2141 family)
MKTILLALFLLLGNNTFCQDIPVKFEINNLRNSDGSIIVSVYKDKKSFADGIPSLRKVIPKKGNMNKGNFKAQFSLPSGVYGKTIWELASFRPGWGGHLANKTEKQGG